MLEIKFFHHSIQKNEKNDLFDRKFEFCERYDFNSQNLAKVSEPNLENFIFFFSALKSTSGAAHRSFFLFVFVVGSLDFY